MLSSVSRALLASLLAAVVLGACSSGSSPSTCSTSSDCATGQTCRAGECLGAGQCPSGILSCTASSQCGAGNTCASGCCAPIEGCASSADCTSASRPHCDTGNHACVPCANSTQCSGGKVCTAAGACESACTSDNNCSGATSHCVLPGGYCGQCTADTQCSDSAPFCQNNVCVGCTSNANCAAPTSICDTSSKTCVVCLDAQNQNGVNSGCPSATPACESGACVACNPANNASSGANGACSGATPSCGPASTCVACTLTSECTQGNVCDSSANTCGPVTLVSFTSSASTILASGTATLTATLNGDVSSATTVNVDIAADGGVAGSLGASTIVIASGHHSGTVVYTAPSAGGTATVEATLGSTTLIAAIHVSSAALSVSSIDLPASSAPGSAVQATITLSAAPSADTAVTVAADNGSTINGAASASITVPSGSATSPAFTLQLACNTSVTTVTTTLNTVNKTATVTLDNSQPSVASLSASPTSIAMGQPVALTATLTKAASCKGVRVLLASSVLYNTNSKYNGYVPSYITVPAGQTSVTANIVPECYGGTGDHVIISASTQGTAPVQIAAPINVANNAAGSVVFCPISPITADRPLTYVLGDGGTAPMPELITVGFGQYKVDGGTYSVSFAATLADGGSCGIFEVDGGTLSGALSFPFATKTELSFLPTVAGTCTLNATASITPQGGSLSTVQAGIPSVYNLIDTTALQQSSPTDLVLSKAEIDENTLIGTDGGTNHDGGVFGDLAEYVEIYNPTAAPIALAAYSLVFVGGAYDNFDGGSAQVKGEYNTIALSGSVAAGHYAIVQDPGAGIVASGTIDALIPLTTPAGNASLTGTTPWRVGNIYNAPGGIFLVKNAGTNTAAIVDGINYGAPVQQWVSQSITGTAGGVFSWPPSPLLPLDNWITDNPFVNGSLVRVGFTGSPALDWADSTTVVPGAANTTITGP